MSAFLFWRGFKTGIIYNVVAPMYAREGSSIFISKDEMARFLLRRKCFSEHYLSYNDMGDFLRWNHYNQATGTRNVRKRMLISGHYMRVVPPPCYRFTLNRRKYFHATDVKIMRGALIKSTRGILQMTKEEGFCEASGLWHPSYLMPEDDLYKSQYKPDTQRLIAQRKTEHHQKKALRLVV